MVRRAGKGNGILLKPLNPSVVEFRLRGFTAIAASNSSLEPVCLCYARKIPLYRRERFIKRHIISGAVLISRLARLQLRADALCSPLNHLALV